MVTETGINLVQLGRETVERVLGRDVVARLDVKASPDASEEPAYYFSIEVDPNERRLGAEDHVRLIMALRDALTDRDDDTYPYLRVLSHEDWNRVFGA